jgi:hypothetical protein
MPLYLMAACHTSRDHLRPLPPSVPHCCNCTCTIVRKAPDSELLFLVPFFRLRFSIDTLVVRDVFHGKVTVFRTSVHGAPRVGRS